MYTNINIFGEQESFNYIVEYQKKNLCDAVETAPEKGLGGKVQVTTGEKQQDNPDCCTQKIKGEYIFFCFARE